MFWNLLQHPGILIGDTDVVGDDAVSSMRARGERMKKTIFSSQIGKLAWHASFVDQAGV
jgi:hypothetical protein